MPTPHVLEHADQSPSTQKPGVGAAVADVVCDGVSVREAGEDVRDGVVDDDAVRVRVGDCGGVLVGVCDGDAPSDSDGVGGVTSGT